MSGHLPPMDPALVEELSARLLAIARDVVEDDLQAMMIKGSAIKGDFIPDFSDFDAHIFADDRVMRGPIAPTSEVAIAFQERFSEIDVPSYRVSQIQVIFVSATNHPPDWIPALPGTYRLIHGSLPDTLRGLTADSMRRHSRMNLVRCREWVDTITNRILDKPDNQLGESVRLAGTILKAGLYEAAVVMGHDPFKTWTAPLSEVLDAVEPHVMPSRPATKYYARAWRWAKVRDSGSELRAMARYALDALEALGEFGYDAGTREA